MRQELYQTVPELENAALIREVHVYGPALELGDRQAGSAQHAGLGRADGLDLNPTLVLEGLVGGRPPGRCQVDHVDLAGLQGGDAFRHDRIIKPFCIRPSVLVQIIYAFRISEGVKVDLAVARRTIADRLPPDARACLESLGRQFLSLNEEICAADKRLQAGHRSSELSRRLATIPGIGPITASALVASITDPSAFRTGREMAAWIGLVPRQNSTGGKPRLGKISKQGDQYLRWLLVAGAMAVIRHAKRRGTANHPWLDDLIARRPTKVAAVALANKMARMAWALLSHGGAYRQPVITASL